MKKFTLLLLGMALSAGWANAYVLFKGDGSDEPGFVAPQQGGPPPPPPSHIASAETYIPYPGPPAAPMARSEKKNPPNPPVLFCKLKSPQGPLDWAARPNDLNNLLKSMKGMLNVNFSMEAKDLAEIDTNPEKNPILYRTGHFHFSHTEAERKRLRDYLLAGGMIIYDAGMGSKPFYDSAKAELAAIFPEIPTQRLSADHPIFHSYYDLDQVQYRAGVRKAGYKNNDPWLEGVSIDCRTVAVVSRFGMGIGWDAVNDEAIQGYSIESAQKLGINLVSYATAQRAWAKSLAHAMSLTDASATTAGKVALVQVMYDGEWKTRHKGLTILLHQFNQKTEIPVKFNLAERKLSDARIFDSPVLYMTGHENFQLSAAEIQNLRKYLQNGGLLFAEACCGRKAFDVAFRREMAKVLPEMPLTPLPATASVFAMPNKIANVGITPALMAQMGNRSMIEPKVEVVSIKNHHSIIYSPYGLAGGWEMSQNPYGYGYDEAGALALGENILLYAVTQ